MGRRKERRLAAISAAGRRVKLDLFAEPPGDSGGSSAQEDVGGDGNSKTHAGLPSSPSSSGQQPENPLLLLEQYSDEELNEGSNEGRNRSASEDASIDNGDESRNPATKEAEDTENNSRSPTTERVEELLVDNGSASQDTFQKLERGSITGSDSDDLQRGQVKVEEATSAAVSDGHHIGDVGSGWKMVLHEESNQYYYWNVSTGETSWEVPDVLAQEIATASVKNATDNTEVKMDAVMGTYKSNMPVDMKEDDVAIRNPNIDSNVNCQTSDGDYQGMQMGESGEGSKPDRAYNEEGHGDANQSHQTSGHDRQSGEKDGDTDLSSQLIVHCQRLLDKLNLTCNAEDQDLKSKYTLEIEIRLADINALASQGSSLRPFWLHSEDQLKQLETAIDDIIQHCISASPTGSEPKVESREAIDDDTGTGSSEKKALFPVVESHAHEYSKIPKPEAYNDGATTIEQVSTGWYSNAYPVDDMEEKNENMLTENEIEITPNPILHSGEDVDMDVDMEVEDTITSVEEPTGGASDPHHCTSAEISDRQNTLTDQESTVPGEVSMIPPVEAGIPPPPPDNEPIPPPPPDDEPFPPPPPSDEPPEISYSSSSTNLELLQPFTYSEQYHLSSYPEYYGQTNLDASATMYTHPEGGQVAVSHVPHYYEAVSNIYAAAPLVVNPAEAGAYYGIQNEVSHPVTLVTGAAVHSSGTQTECVPEHLVTGAAGSLSSHADTLKAPLEVPGAQPSSVASTAASKINNVSISSKSEATGSASASAASKVQSKALRGKKRTVAVVSTLRSNKKVSSLVDKWKAAKEELHEEEDEPQDAYEILEKKRQREIEEWRAHQIASGEAKDNANFQPLGGDWRERVKRRRAEKMKEAGQSSSNVATDGNKQSDVLELSKGLPSGWQAYWDESSKQVYYGNVLTSETTWTRPAD